MRGPGGDTPTLATFALILVLNAVAILLGVLLVDVDPTLVHTTHLLELWASSVCAKHADLVLRNVPMPKEVIRLGAFML